MSREIESSFSLRITIVKFLSEGNKNPTRIFNSMVCLQQLIFDSLCLSLSRVPSIAPVNYHLVSKSQQMNKTIS